MNIQDSFSFRMDWLDLLAVQGTLKSVLQHHTSKASILRRSAFFIVQLSHPYMTTGKTIALTRQLYKNIMVNSRVLLLFSRSDMSDSLWPHGLQHSRLPYTSPPPKICSNSCPLSQYAIQPYHYLSSYSPPAFNLSQHQGLYKWVVLCIRWPRYCSFSTHPSNEWIFMADFL